MSTLIAERGSEGTGDWQPGWLGALKLTVATASLVPLRPWRPPSRPAVALRGALGAAILHGVCVREDRDCRSCPWAGDCPVASWYDPGRVGSALPRPFSLRVLSAPRRVSEEQPLVVQWVFITPPPRPSVVIEGLCRAARLGLGRDRIPHRVRHLMVQGEGCQVAVIEDERQRGGWPEPGSLLRLVRLPDEPSGARVNLLTPLQLRDPGPPEAADVLRAAVGRLRSVGRAQGLPLNRWWPDPRGLTGRWEGLRRSEGGRYSRRQGYRVDLSGWLGTLVLGPEVAAWADLLAAAEVLQIGRQSAAGLGRIAVGWS